MECTKESMKDGRTNRMDYIWCTKDCIQFIRRSIRYLKISDVLKEEENSFTKCSKQLSSLLIAEKKFQKIPTKTHINEDTNKLGKKGATGRRLTVIIMIECSKNMQLGRNLY